MGRWQRYWFADGGRLGAAAVRIAIALAVLMALDHLDHSAPSLAEVLTDRTLYRPIGPWLVLGHWMPPLAAAEVLRIVAYAAAAAMLVGFYTRTATALSCAAGIALTALSFAQSPTWSHQYNVVFLAQLAFLGARGGDALSVDALIRRWRGRPAEHRARGYQWSLRLAQLAVALMFAGAAFHKLGHGHFTLHWALSDNLRNQLLVRFDLAHVPRPPLADWLMADPWRYRTAAVLNIITQTAPLAACALMRRPLWRAAAGACFVVETILLGLVVDLWNPQWLPLYAVFVDWDALIAWVRGWRTAQPAAAAPPAAAVVAQPPSPPRRAARIFVALFVAYDLLTAIVPGLDQTLRTYPFSSFPMFAKVLANPPYLDHTDYVVVGERVVLASASPPYPFAQSFFDHGARDLPTIRDPAELRARLAALLAQGQHRYPDLGITGLQLELVMFVARAYPAPAGFDAHAIAVIAALDGAGFRTKLGPFDRARIAAVGAVGDTLYYYNDEPIRHAYTGMLDGDPVYVVAQDTDGTPWLVASHADWHWR